MNGFVISYYEHGLLDLHVKYFIACVGSIALNVFESLYWYYGSLFSQHEVIPVIFYHVARINLSSTVLVRSWLALRFFRECFESSKFVRILSCCCCAYLVMIWVDLVSIYSSLRSVQYLEVFFRNIGTVHCHYPSSKLADLSSFNRNCGYKAEHICRNSWLPPRLLCWVVRQLFENFGFACW